MDHHIHHVRGRLRIRTPHLKRRAERAQAVVAELRRTRGIKSAEANVITGSLLIYYEPAQTDAAGVIAAVERLLPQDEWPPAVVTPSRPRVAQDRFERKIAETVFWYAIEKAVERAAPLVLSALL
jgi:hypothetical protein